MLYKGNIGLKLPENVNCIFDKQIKIYVHPINIPMMFYYFITNT